jgi:diguanylate cyclase (GGDEF)-like protein
MECDDRQTPILLVEDDSFMRTIIKVALAEAGYDTVAVENGRKALEMLDKRHYPIVITDWFMPEMDGLDLCRAIRSRSGLPYTYIILMTAMEARSGVVTALDAGADEYLVKPVDPVELQVRLKTARRIIDLESTLQRSMEEIRLISQHDHLTGLYNRRYCDERLPQELKRSRRYRRPLSLVMIDIDFFKRVNDEHGHQAGDLVLCELTRHIAASIRQGVDWLVRFGGEEFLLVLPETDLAGATVVAERIRFSVSQLPISLASGITLEITASLGVVATTPGDELSPQGIIEAADRALYDAKGLGRNQVVGAQL